MKKLYLVVILAVAAYVAIDSPGTIGIDSPGSEGDRQPEQTSETRAFTSDDDFSAAFRDGRSNIQLEGEGRVVKVLPDDEQGSRHQKFIVRLASGQTLLVSHNIDLAPRVAPLGEGDSVRFRGEYEWSERGGVIHWTHDDPQGRHPGGWIEREGERFH